MTETFFLNHQLLNRSCNFDKGNIMSTLLSIYLLWFGHECVLKVLFEEDDLVNWLFTNNTICRTTQASPYLTKNVYMSSKRQHSTVFLTNSCHSLMIPANSLLCSSSRNIKEFQRDLRFRHSQTVLFTIPPKSVLY